MAEEILCLGEPLFELSEVTDGETSRYLPGYGGDTSNVAVAAARQGARVAMITRLGADAFGDRFVSLWNDEGIDTAAVERDPDAPTGIYLISYDDAGHHFTYFRSGSAASLMTPEDLPRDRIAAARVLHLSGISQAISDSACDAAFEAIEIASSNGVRISYDTNLRLKLWPLPRARAITMATAALSDYCLPSLDDARQLTGLSDPLAAARAFREAGARNVLLKMGADGVLIVSEDEREPVTLPSFGVDAVDATGAGDCFDGAFLASIGAGATTIEAARYASAAAALSTLGHGAVNPIPRREQVLEFINERG